MEVKVIVITGDTIYTYNLEVEKEELSLLEEGFRTVFSKWHPKQNIEKILLVMPGQHLCKYCGEHVVNDKDEDLLCLDCQEAFGHHKYSEL